MKKYILSVDQSTQGTKGLLFDEQGSLICRTDRSHRQIISPQGWVSHDLNEILNNTLQVCREVIEKSGIDKTQIAAMGISNQRETTAAWNRRTGEPVCDAVVWQCSRAKEICDELAGSSMEAAVKNATGIPLSAYFPAAKMAWILKYVPEASALADKGDLAMGTIDSWLIYSLCEGHPFRCDYSNASRTQLFNIMDLCWDSELCRTFGVPAECLPDVAMSDSCFGYTDLGGYLDQPVPVHAVLGDSHGALLGHGGILPGSIKSTYGTGSSVMMNTGEHPVLSRNGLATSLAWGLNGKISYVMEGNLNYTGAVITWLKDDVELIKDASETARLAMEANPADKAYFVPAFSGLGAPYWDSDATGMLTGVTRSTGKKEIVKACLESIAYQITDLVLLMETESGFPVNRLDVDGGPTANSYLMQFQADITGKEVCVPSIQEFSGFGAAIAAGCGVGLYGYDHLPVNAGNSIYSPAMDNEKRSLLYQGWKNAVERVLRS